MDVGGTNLAALSKVSAHGAGSVLVEDYIFTITSEAAAYDGTGLRISPDIFAPGGRCILTFRVRKTSGTLAGIGGHATAFSQAALYLDGEKRAERWTQGAPLPDDEEEHMIELHLIFGGGAEADALYIQPNRGFADASGPYSVQIWDLQVERGTVATDWYPAPEDIQDSMELQLTNARAQITAATDAIRQEVEATYARADDLDAAVARLNTLAEQTEDSFTWTIQQ